MKTAFDDLENDDNDNSLDSSHYQDDTRDTNYSNSMVNSAMQSVTPGKDQMVAQGLQEDFSTCNHIKNLNDVITNHRSDPELNDCDGITQIDMSTDFSLYRQTETPLANIKFNDSNSTSLETPYELAKPPIGVFPQTIHHPQIEECTVNENYPSNYETPSNHYNTRTKRYSNNGFTNRYGNNVQNKIHLGGGDNAISDHINHCYNSSPNGMVDDNVAYKNAEYNSKEQLEVLYMVRMKEINRLTEELQQLQLEKEQQENYFSKKLMLLQAEVDRTNISKNEAQHALGKRANYSSFNKRNTGINKYYITIDVIL